MTRIDLNGTWQMKVIGDKQFGIVEDWMDAEVPGSVLDTLLKNNKIPDPFYRDNERKILELMNCEFVYQLDFDASAAVMNMDETYLVFEGVDTLGRVYLNEMPLGTTDNMHRVWEFDVAGVIRMGNNTLRVVISPPIPYITQEQEKCFTGGVPEAVPGYPHLRKSHCSFGWDWAPHIPDAGIFRSVYVTGIRDKAIKDFYVTQNHSDDKVTLDVDVEFQGGTMTRRHGESDDTHTEIIVTDPNGKRIMPGPAGNIVIKNPQIWWPNGYGAHPLYTVKVTLMTIDGTVLDEMEKRIGLRTIGVHQEKDQWGESFAHEINGVQIFAMGADMVPMDAVLGRINEERTRKLLEDCVAANYNTIRVWGGGYYPDDYFYDICDELGLLVWQDLMFACASYELTPEFEENICAEITDNVKRIRNHACLALWCGNNELEEHVDEEAWEPTKKQKVDYIKMFEYIIPHLVEELDPNTFFWQSSPSSGGSFDDPNDENRGDAHYWEVWHGQLPYAEYRKYFFRYLSEFGFQSFPGIESVKEFTEEEDRNIYTRVMEMHQRNADANSKIVRDMANTYLYPGSFEDVLYTSQLLQTDAIRYGVEHFRRHRGRCMGAIVWQLNDIWPAASWSSIDYYGRWKALHYAQKRMFTPTLISCEEVGEMTERPSVNMIKDDIEKSAKLNISNERMEEVEGIVRWALRKTDGSVLKQAEVKVKIPPLKSVWFEKLDFSDCDEYHTYFSYELEIGGKVESSGTSLFALPKHFCFEDPQLSCRIEGDNLIVHAEKFAKNVMIYNPDGELLLSDNYFDMNPGEVAVKILGGNAENVQLKSVYNIGR